MASAGQNTTWGLSVRGRIRDSVSTYASILSVDKDEVLAWQVFAKPTDLSCLKDIETVTSVGSML
jgi:hypothetical protein